MTTGVGEGNPRVGGVDGILDAHRTIQDLTRQLEEVADLIGLQVRLEAFRTFLEPHFAEEEAPDGFFDLVRGGASRHLAKLRQLEEEHATLLGNIDAIAEQARACLAGPVAEVLKQAARLAQRVREHEAHESALLVDALYVDVGAHD